MGNKLKRYNIASVNDNVWNKYKNINIFRLDVCNDIFNDPVLKNNVILELIYDDV